MFPCVDIRHVDRRGAIPGPPALHDPSFAVGAARARGHARTAEVRGATFGCLPSRRRCRRRRFTFSLIGSLARLAAPDYRAVPVSIVRASIAKHRHASKGCFVTSMSRSAAVLIKWQTVP